MEQREMLDRKYAQLLLRRCLSFNNTDTLLIDYNTHEHDKFVEIIIDEAKKMNIKNIGTYLCDEDEFHEYLKNIDLENIELNPLLDRTSWNETAKKDGCVLHINTFIPELMNDIDEEKITKASEIRIKTYKYYKQNNTQYNFPWVICAYPNERWANYLFNNDKDAYLKLYNYIIKMCMVDKECPVNEWQKYIIENNYYKDNLNRLEINKLYYKNSLGTDFEIGFPKKYEWLNMDKTDKYGSPIMVNMPSYEIFTTPDSKTANGIVYNSRPLVFNGKIIDDFYIEFKDGKAINYKAKIGNESLIKIIENYQNSNRLGEVALVNNNSPISNTGIVFYDTLFDENASCHLALGRGSKKTIVDCLNLSKEEIDKSIDQLLDEYCINKSDIHVDFMIGTSDLEIKADTNKGKKKIFKNGNFSI